MHDDHPLPDKLNRAARGLLYVGRRVKHALTPHGQNPVPRNKFLSARPFKPMPFEEAEAWFRRVHEANEAVYHANGAWSPQPYATYAGQGIPIEEVAHRIPGYLSAYRATQEPVYLERAYAAGDYILRERLFTDGHLLLQGHLLIDATYPFAGAALLALWDRDRSRTEYFDAARKIGDQLLECHIAGILDHACAPVQLLGPLYRYTGDRRYLRAAIRRVFRRALPFQLPSGDWDGQQMVVWYQGINLRNLIAMYVSTPFTLENQGRKDRLARSIVAATNWFLALQDATGAFPLTRLGGSAPISQQMQIVSFDGSTFCQDPTPRAYLVNGGYEIDALVAMYEHLHVSEVLPALHGYASLVAGTHRFGRLEFNTLGAGRYLGLLADLVAAPPAAVVLEKSLGDKQSRHWNAPLAGH